MTPLTLRDVHEGVAPAWWPPAPGWWLVLAFVAVVAIALAWRQRRARRRAAAVMHVFDDALARAATPSQQVAAMSELLRRAARRRHPGADSLQGDDWLRVLDDGMPQPVFSTDAGRLLLDGGFRDDVTAAEAAALCELARQRYLAWMQGA